MHDYTEDIFEQYTGRGEPEQPDDYVALSERFGVMGRRAELDGRPVIMLDHGCYWKHALPGG